MRPILVIGGMNMDILGVPEAAMVLRESNKGQVLLRPGGVGRNIAQQLGTLGAPVELMTVLGDDDFSRMLEDSCRQLGIGLRFSLRVRGRGCVYLALHDRGGDMLAALNDMEAMAALHGRYLREALPRGGFSACVLDANLGEETLLAAAEHLEAPLIADPVSCEKAGRLLPILHRLTALKPNLREAQQLSGQSSPEAAASALLDRGVAQVYVSCGAEGLYYASRQAAGYLTALPVPEAPATGAGDAMVAGLSLAIAQGLDIGAAARLGQQCAAAHLKRTSRDHDTEKEQIV
ncbi:MAG: carbohydrate kinase family protein [Christensenellales bacterium]